MEDDLRTTDHQRRCLIRQRRQQQTLCAVTGWSNFTFQFDLSWYFYICCGTGTNAGLLKPQRQQQLCNDRLDFTSEQSDVDVQVVDGSWWQWRLSQMCIFIFKARNTSVFKTSLFFSVVVNETCSSTELHHINNKTEWGRDKEGGQSVKSVSKLVPLCFSSWPTPPPPDCPSALSHKQHLKQPDTVCLHRPASDCRVHRWM